MISIEAKNITDVFYQGLENFESKAKTVSTGRRTMKELSPVMINVKNPLQRCLIVPKRNNSIVATLAECLWVLGGRNDVKYLERYIPQAKRFSSDGLVWGAAYGERLQKHFEVNQIKEAFKELKKTPNSSQANMAIFDPKIDLKSFPKQAPCTLGIHFAIRDNKLNTFVAMRSNDIIWGFSHINFFEWSIVSEMLAYWLNVEVGEYYQFNMAWRIFERHYALTQDILKSKLDNDIYSKKRNIEQIKVDIDYDMFDQQMEKFFEIESKFSFGRVENIDDLVLDIDSMSSKFLQNGLKILLCYFLIKNDQTNEFISIFETIHYDYTKISAAELFLRNNKENATIKNYLSNIFDLWEI